MSVKLDGKFIPIEYYGEYNARVRPEERYKITPEGEERYAQDLPFRITLDKFGNIYLIPLEAKNAIRGGALSRVYELMYTINDIVESAGGNADKRKMIDDIHESLQKKYFQSDLMTQEYVDFLWGLAKDTFVQDYAAALGKQPSVPTKVTTHTSLSVDEAKALAAKALQSTN